MRPGNEREVLAEQIRLAYRNTVRTPIGMILLVAALAYLIGSETDSQWPYLWSAVVLAIHLSRSWLIFRELAQDRASEELIRRSRITRMMTTAMGLVIAVGVLVFVPPLSLMHQALVTMVCIGWLAGVVGVFGPYPSYIRAWFVLFGGSLVAAWLLRGTGESAFVALLIALLVFFLWMTTHDIGNKAVESIKIRFENIDLLESLKQRQRELEDASVTKSRFMAAASHDLRQPMVSISLLQSAMLRTRTLEDAHAAAHKLSAPIESLRSTLESLVEIARLEGGAVTPRPVETSLPMLADEVRDRFGPCVDPTKVRFTVEATDAVVLIDPHLTMRVLANLVDNAVKFTPEGAVHARLELDDETLAMTVEDTGTGIAPEHLERIFDEYYQAHPASGTSHGLGLGLSIVQRITAILGGDVRIESEPGKGTTVRVFIPARRSLSVAASNAAPAPAAEDRGFAAVSRLMFIDDDPDIQDAISAWAEGLGVAVTYASSAEEALEYARSIPQPEIVISDYGLPGSMNGLDLLRRLRERWPTLRAILLTGNVDAKLPREAAAMGVSFLPKTLAPDRLRAEIQSLLVPTE